MIARLTGLDTVVALLIVSHLAFFALLVFFQLYLASRQLDAGLPRVPSHYLDAESKPGDACKKSLAPIYATVLLAVWPTTVFFRMAYSESLFLLLCIVSLYGIPRWSPLGTTAVIGLATATRPVGVCLIVPFLLQLMSQCSWRTGLRRVIVYVPLSCWGLVSYMLYQYVAFGEPFGFAKTQEHWRWRGEVPPLERIAALLALEPVWGVFDPMDPCYWGRVPPGNPLLSFQFANPIYFLVAVATIALGAMKRWLTRNEIAVAVPLIAIPYITRGFEMCMNSQARYVSLVLPMYLVLGQLLCRAPAAVSLGLIGLASVNLMVYSALFAARYAVF